MSAAPVLAVTDPSFATVTLVFADDGVAVSTPSEIPVVTSAEALEPKTIRVPITPQTTIRELAKGAMTRYMFSLRRITKSSDLIARRLCRTGIVVTEVHLLSSPQDAASQAAFNSNNNNNSSSHEYNGNAARLAPSRIELFSEDCVTQVVRVKEEVVYMRFKGASEHARKRRADQTDTAATTLPKSNVEVGEVRNEVPPFQQLHTTTIPKPNVSNWSVMPAENSVTTSLTMGNDGVCVGSNTEELNRGEISMSVPVPLVGSNVAVSNSTTITVPGRKKQTVSKPKALRSTTSSKLEGEKQEESDGNYCDDGSTGSSESDEEEKEKIARSIATLRQAETRRMPWGPDAYKHFATNYVNSPQKILRGRYSYERQQKRQQRQQPPPSVKLSHAAQTQEPAKPTDVSEAEEKKESPKPQKDQPGKLNSEKDCADAAPLKMARVEDVSSCDHSQVSVALSCGTSSPSTTPNVRAASDTCSRYFSPGPATALEALAADNGTPATLEGVTASVIKEEASLKEDEVKEAKGEGEKGCLTQIHKKLTTENLVTPKDVVVGSTASLDVPGTVAKPVQVHVARQLSFDEESESSASNPAAHKTKACGENSTQGVQVLRVHKVYHFVRKKREEMHGS